ncbi:MAG: hypothetical protein ACREA0_22960, partial [bacterium]
VEDSYEPQGAPWAYGSSLMHGLQLSRGTIITRNLSLANKPVTVEIQALGLDDYDGRSAMRVAVKTAGGHWALPRGAGPVTGEFLVESGNPYVVQGELRYLSYPGDGGPAQVFTGLVQQVRLERGNGAEISLGGPSNDFWSRCYVATQTVSDGMPPGAAFRIPEFEASFAEFVEFLRAQDPKLSASIDAGTGYVASIAIANRSSASTASVVQERSVEAEIKYHLSNGTLTSVVITKSTTSPNPLGNPPNYWQRGGGTQPTALPLATTWASMVPLDLVYEAHKKTRPDWVARASLVATPAGAVENGTGSEPFFSYYFWTRIDDTTIVPTVYDARNGCLLRAVHL